MKTDKFSYILDDNNQTKEVNDFEALKLESNYFETHSVEQFKVHVKNLLIEFHPDKNAKEDEIRANEVTKRIIIASKAIKNNIERNNGKYKSNDARGEFHFFDADNDFDDDFN